MFKKLYRYKISTKPFFNTESLKKTKNNEITKTKKKLKKSQKPKTENKNKNGKTILKKQRAKINIKLQNKIPKTQEKTLETK